MNKNAIVIMFDSLQFNYLGCYGNDWIKTPNMDRLAKEGVLFENCYTEGLPTVPCRRSMHTGRYYVHVAGWVPLEMGDTTIADLCWGRPIDTALIFDCPMYRLPKFGYTRGFDKVYFTHGQELDQYYYEEDPIFELKVEDYFSESSLENARKHLGDSTVDFSLQEIKGYLAQMQYWKSADDRYVAKTVHKAIEYLEQVDRNKQFYLWIDSFDPHEPWNPPSVYLNFPCPYDPDYKGPDEFLPWLGDVDKLYTEEEMNHVRMLYAEDVTVCDTYLGQLMDAIRRLGFEENTLLMMVSDHGEPMGNGKHGHGIMRKCRPWPYEELSHTPMIMRFPGCEAGKRVKGFVQSCDVAPTVCDWLGIGVHPAMHGKSLLPLALGQVDKVRDFAISGYHRGGLALYTEDWVLMHWMSQTKGNMDNLSDNIESMKKNSAELAAVGGKRPICDMVNTDALEASAAEDKLARQDAAYSVDGNDQWTCTPGSLFVVHAEDELYDRNADPFMLNNIIGAKRDVARKLLNTLEDFLASLS